MTDDDPMPLRPPSNMLEDETVERGYYCEAHSVVKVIDKLGRAVCPVCLVDDYIGELSELLESGDPTGDWVTDADPDDVGDQRL